MTPPPDVDVLAAWASLRRSHDLVVQEIEAALLGERGLTLAWFDVLDALQHSRGRLRATELAEQVLAKTSTLTRQLDRLEASGLVRRERNAGGRSDGRVVTVILTPDGRSAWRRASTTYARVVKRATAAHLCAADGIISPTSA